MRYVPVTDTSSFQPIRSNSPNAVYSFHPVQEISNYCQLELVIPRCNVVYD